MKLIDADALSEHKFQEVDFHGGSLNAAYRQGWNDAIDAIVDNEDAVDAVPVRHGRWIRVYSRPGVLKYLGWTCDQCGQRTGNEYAPQWYKFCPNCGARMDGEDGDHDRG